VPVLALLFIATALINFPIAIMNDSLKRNFIEGLLGLHQFKEIDAKFKI